APDPQAVFSFHTNFFPEKVETLIISTPYSAHFFTKTHNQTPNHPTQHPHPNLSTTLLTSQTATPP
ncbi:hypothetical protein, partial [Antarctobacter sp.]|uniref:hypothetical protein n=1 Tax=Antarctobacter sp. TaxID=1872577 RepID=UPI002B2714A1